MHKLKAFMMLAFLLALTALSWGIAPGWAAPVTTPGMTPDYFETPNWANSPPLRKFVDTLAPLGCTATNNLGQCIPVAVPDTTTYPGSDYYEIELVEYRERMHSDLPALNIADKLLATSGGTKLRGYRQTNGGAALLTPQYLGPMIIAQKDRPVRVKFTNKLPTGAGGNLFLPVDASIDGAGEGPLTSAGAPCDPETAVCANFTQNRATLHLHGGRSPWISDGTPQQWIAPVGETTPYVKGVSMQNVPDMPDPGPGAQTFYWTNQQSSRMMFYHDHAYGITRLNVYAGEAAVYLIQDDAEAQLVTAGLIPADQIPLVIQEKTFVDANPASPTYVRKYDPLWNWGTGTPVSGIRPPTAGDLWYPHVYMPAQNPYSIGGINDMGRWHYAPWFYPPTEVCGSSPQAVKPWCIEVGTKPNPYYSAACVPDPTLVLNNNFCQPPEIPGTPDVSWGAEAFLDTLMVNGTVYPTLTVDPKAYRLRILNAGNDRFMNLQLYKATSIVSGVTLLTGGSGYSSRRPPRVTITGAGGVGVGATARATVDGVAGSPTFGKVTAIELLTVGSGYVGPLAVTIAAPLSGTTATASATVYTNAPTGGVGLTEVGMVPAAFDWNYPLTWPADGREGGVPDPATAGPAFIQIGTEGGFLPAPVLLPNQPVQWNLDPTMFNVGNVLNQADGGGTLFLGPAERADVIVDFSNYAGQTLILYNDAPTAFPALDPHYDYYTGAPDRRDMGGYPGILPPGVGPNVRTVMQIKVTGAGGIAPPDDYNPTTLADLDLAFASDATTQGVFAGSQDPVIVGQSAYDSTYNRTFPATWPYYGISRISDTSLSFMDTAGVLVDNFPMQPKALHDEMGATFDNYGRMSAKLGLAVPFSTTANATFAVQNYVDAPSEILTYGTPQIWKINHNGVDTHPIHFHLFDVQLINRVGWDGFKRLPDANELGWKDTLRISPLEDTIVALRPKLPALPFGLPDSIRPLNPIVPLGSQMGFSQIDPLTGNAVTTPTTNVMYNFHHEYVWHCHILSHEENDMMRTMVVIDTGVVLPDPPDLTDPPVLSGGGTEILLAWTDGTPAPNLGNPANEVGFRIERATFNITTGVIAAWVVVATAPANTTTYSDTTFLPGQNYKYRVVAFNSAGDSPSNVATYTAVAAVPGTPTGFTATPSVASLSLPSVTLTWNSVAGATGYRVFQYTAAGVLVGKVGGDVLAPATTITHTGLQPNTTYYYKVRAYNIIGAGPLTNPAISAITAGQLPGVPTNFRSLSRTTTSITLGWTGVTNATGYRVFRYTAAGVLVGKVGGDVLAPTTTITNTGLTTGTTYYYKVRAYNAAGAGALTTPALAVTTR